MEKSMKKISIEKCGFYLPECAYYDFINDAPDDANKATIVKKAMEAIEDENPKMEGVLPKKYMISLYQQKNLSFFLILYVFLKIFLKIVRLIISVKFMNFS